MFVRNLSQTYKTQLTARNVSDETNFYQLVLEGNISLSDQLAYRQEQAKRVADDPDEKKRVKEEILSLKDRIEQKQFSDDYLAKVSDFQSGLSGIDSVISFLTTQKGSTTDERILSDINQKLAEANQTKFNLTKELIGNQTDFALKDKSAAVVDTQISRVQSAKAQALLTGNDALASAYDLQIQSLQKAKNDNALQLEVAGLATLSASGGMSATGLLDALNAKISNAVSSGPVEIGGVTYPSLKDFWTYKRDSYLIDSSSNGFFGQFASEQKDNLAVLNSKGTLSISNLTGVASAFNSLAGRPELAQFQRQLDIYRQDSMQSGANYLADKAYNQFTVDLDITKASATLGALKTLGVNVDDTYTKILTSNAATKNAQVQNILTAASNAMANDPNITPQQAIQQAIAAGAGAVISPLEAATKSEGTLATDLVNSASAGAGATDPRTTVGGQATPGQPAPVSPTAPANAPTSSVNLSSATISSLPNLQPGMSSSDVATLQTYLIQQGYSIPDGATGFYGPQTTAAVAQFQADKGIDAQGNPGYFGPITKGYLTTSAQPAAAPSPTPNPAPTPAPQPAPAPSPTPSPTTSGSGYTFVKRPDGLVETYQNGSRISTGTASSAASYGYTGT